MSPSAGGCGLRAQDELEELVLSPSIEGLTEFQIMPHHIFSPYRVCPLGAHVDHQHGLVTGFAIDKGVDLWFDVREDSKVILDSETFDGHVEFDIATPTLVKQGNWGDYARGAKFALQKRFKLSRGISGVIKGSLPIGGLSSSAAWGETGNLECLGSLSKTSYDSSIHNNGF